MKGEGPGVPLAETEGGAGDEARVVGWEVEGDIREVGDMVVVEVDIVKSG